jgi:glycosyltransferase involved in cell wall biosynthesis
MQKNGLFKLLKVIPLTFRLIKELVIFKPDIVYFSISPLGGAFLRDSLFVSIIKLFPCKIIHHLHGKGISNVSSSILKRLYSFVFHNTNIICLSERLTHDIVNVKNNANLFTCANGVEVQEISHKSIKSKKTSLLFLSNLLPLKGINLYLEAAARLLNEGYDLEINIAGPFTNKYSEQDFNNFLLENSNIKNAINYHGSVSGVQKWTLLKETDVFVHPTYNDAFPLVILEAMASGCIIISTDQGGIPDIIKNKPFGFVLKEINSINLYETLVSVLHKKDFFQKFKNDSITNFNEKYTKECFELRISKIFKDVLKS